MAVAYPPLFEREKVGDLKVVRDEVLESGLSGHVGRFVPIHGIRVLTLEDDSVVYGCRECVFTGTRGEVKAHRGAEHGIAMGGSPAKRSADPAVAGQLPYPGGAVLSMTLFEVLELGEAIGEWEEVLTKLEQQRDDARAELVEARRAQRAAERETEKIKRTIKKMIGEV